MLDFAPARRRTWAATVKNPTAAQGLPGDHTGYFGAAEAEEGLSADCSIRVFMELMRLLTSSFLALPSLLLLLVPQPCAAASLSPLSLHVGGMDF